MKVSQLIEHLKKMPADADVWHLWDGALRTEINHVWLTREGDVGTGDHSEPCYSEDERPIDAPDEKQDPYWLTPEKNNHDG